MRVTVLVCLTVWLLAGAVCRAEFSAPDERGLWLLWVNNTNNVENHATIVAACREFGAKTNQDPLVVVAKGLEAWHLLKMGNSNEAIRCFGSMLAVPEGASPLQNAGAEMARVWLTRFDREIVRMALKKIYVRDIEFPATLEPINTLKIRKMPPFTDRWGKPWTYRLQSSIKGMGNQQYLLESTRLGSTSDLVKALARPYAAGINLEPVGDSPDSAGMYEFASPFKKSIFLQAGGEMEGIMVAYMGKNIIVLSDGSHWRVVVKPR